MHKNLIKVNEMLAFANNNDGVISLISKKGKDYSFEDIISKEQEIDELGMDFKNKNTENENFVKNKKNLIIDLLMGLFTLFGLLASVVLFTTVIHSSGITIGSSILLGSFLFIVFTPITLKVFIKECIQYKKEIKNFEEVKEELERVRELLNSKKEELEKMLDKVDFREYTDKKQIENIISNMFGITQSNEVDNILNKDESNTINLDGPILTRRKDV